MIAMPQLAIYFSIDPIHMHKCRLCCILFDAPGDCVPRHSLDFSINPIQPLG